MDADIPKTFPNAEMILTVGKSSQGTQQIWAMIEETTFEISAALAFFDEENVRRLNKYQEG